MNQKKKIRIKKKPKIRKRNKFIKKSVLNTKGKNYP